MKLIQKMAYHLSGKFSDSSYRIFSVAADGTEVDTKITRHVRVAKPSKDRRDYETIAHELHFGTDTYDLLKQRHGRQWIRRRLGMTPPT